MFLFGWTEYSKCWTGQQNKDLQQNNWFKEGSRDKVHSEREFGKIIVSFTGAMDWRILLFPLRGAFSSVWVVANDKNAQATRGDQQPIRFLDQCFPWVLARSGPNVCQDGHVVRNNRDISGCRSHFAIRLQHFAPVGAKASEEEINRWFVWLSGLEQFPAHWHSVPVQTQVFYPHRYEGGFGQQTTNRQLNFLIAHLSQRRDF